MTDNKLNSASAVVPAARHGFGFKLGLGATLIAVPLGSVLIFMHLKNAGERKNASEEQGASYEADSVRQIDPSEIKYQQSGQIATGLKYARAIAMDAKGRILVAGDRKVRLLEAEGNLISEFALPDFPACVASIPGTEGSVLVGFKDRIELFAADGHLLKSWKSFGDRAQLTGLAIVGNEIIVADAGRRVVVRCDFDGKVLGEWGQRDDARGAPGLVLPSPFLNVRPNGDGQLLVSNPGRHRVETYSLDGQLQSFFGVSGAATASFIGCCNPSHMAVMSDGRIVTAEKGVARVKVYLPDGKLEGVVAGPDLLGSGEHGFELAVDLQDHIFVLEPGAREIRVFVPTVPKTAGAL